MSIHLKVEPKELHPGTPLRLLRTSWQLVYLYNCRDSQYINSTHPQSVALWSCWESLFFFFKELSIPIYIHFTSSLWKQGIHYFWAEDKEHFSFHIFLSPCFFTLIVDRKHEQISNRILTSLSEVKRYSTCKTLWLSHQLLFCTCWC